MGMSKESASLQRTQGRFAFVAFLFSVIVPGLGQFYNGQARRAIGIYLTELALALFVIATGWLWIRWGLAGFEALILMGWLVHLSVGLEAARTAWRGGVSLPLKRYNRPLVYIAVIFGNWLFVPVILVALLTPTLPHWGARTYSIPSYSMSPTLKAGDRVFVDQTAYRTQPPRPMDLVIYQRPEESFALVGRVVALGGDQVEVRDGRLLVNELLVSPPWDEQPTDDYGPIEVPLGEAFIMGDNVNNARDSRYAGSVSLENITAKLRYIWDGPGAGTEFP